MANVFDVAKYILRKAEGEIPTIKLQKLCYYAFVQRLIDSDIELFKEPFEAWANGPVCRELFEVHKGKFFISTRTIPNKKLTRTLSKEETASIEKAIEKYWRQTENEISKSVCAEEPWRQARKNTPNSQPCRNIIEVQAIRDYYCVFNKK